MYNKCPHSMFLKIVKGIYEQNRYKRKDDIEENEEKQKNQPRKSKKIVEEGREKKQNIVAVQYTLPLFKGS